MISPLSFSALLDTLKRDNKDVLPIAEKLMEKEMSTCTSKLKLYMVEKIQFTGAP